MPGTAGYSVITGKPGEYNAMIIFQQPDSTHHQTEQTVVNVQAEAPAEAQHPYQTLRQLPADATPAQEDSALQAIYSKQQYSWSAPTDTLLNPEMATELKPETNEIPVYYHQLFFGKDSLTTSGRYGMAGDPVAYSIGNDNVMTPVLIAAFLMLMYCLKKSHRFYTFHLKHFMRQSRDNSTLEKEALPERKHIDFAIFHAALTLGMLTFFCTKAYITDTYRTHSDYTLMAIYIATSCLFFLTEAALTHVVCNTFFTKQVTQQWTTAKTMLTALLGIILSPMLLLTAFFGLSTENALFYAIAAVVSIKILLFCKCFLIFLRKKVDFLNISLYLCTLEIIPPLLLIGIIIIVANMLRVTTE